MTDRSKKGRLRISLALEDRALSGFRKSIFGGLIRKKILGACLCVCTIARGWSESVVVVVVLA